MNQSGSNRILFLLVVIGFCFDSSLITAINNLSVIPIYRKLIKIGKELKYVCKTILRFCLKFINNQSVHQIGTHFHQVGLASKLKFLRHY